MFGSADLCVADRATRDAMHRATVAAEAAERAAEAAVVFLGGPPASQSTTYICRIHVYQHDPIDVWSRGALILPSGVRVPWIAYSDGVHDNQPLFQSHARVAVTAYCLAGDWYLTGIRAATDTEWQDAADGLH